MKKNKLNITPKILSKTLLTIDIQPYGAHVAIHEMGHLFGLPDLYAYEPSPQGTFSGIWDLMGWLGLGLRLLTYHRLRLAWIDLDVVDCVEETSSYVEGGYLV